LQKSGHIHFGLTGKCGNVDRKVTIDITERRLGVLKIKNVKIGSSHDEPKRKISGNS
jgi:hypothetical protein